MKMHVQLVNVDDLNGWCAGTATIPLKSEDLALPLDEFVERYLKPAFLSARARFESAKEEQWQAFQ